MRATKEYLYVFILSFYLHMNIAFFVEPFWLRIVPVSCVALVFSWQLSKIITTGNGPLGMYGWAKADRFRPRIAKLAIGMHQNFKKFLCAIWIMSILSRIPFACAPPTNRSCPDWCQVARIMPSAWPHLGQYLKIQTRFGKQMWQREFNRTAMSI
jgi:hypothetical protein